MIEAAGDMKLTLSNAEALRVKLEKAIASDWQDKDWSCFTDVDRIPSSSRTDGEI